MHLNCRIVLNKITDIEDFLTQLPVSDLALTETWLEPDLIDTMMIPGHRFLHKSRPTGTGGGVGFLIKENITF